jgi:peptidyl-prolyl cis-trans isomerase SurA
MMTQIKVLLICAALLELQAGYCAESAAAKVPPADVKQVQLIDSIVAVINDDVITRYELDDRLRVVKAQLQKQGTELPALDMLEKQLLERMITDMLQLQFAKENGIRVDDTQLDLAITRIAQQNNFPSLAEFRAKLESEGVEFKKFREEIRSEIISTRLREREVESKLVISENDIDNYLANQAKIGGSGEEYHLAHIQVSVPEQASAEKIQAARDRVQQAIKQLQGGADFAQVSAGSSDAKDALKGGDLGWRTSDAIPQLFMNELQSLKPGQITGILRSPSGLHILKLVGKRSSKGGTEITQTHARHILIKSSEIVSEAEAKKRIMEIKQRIEAGADFADEAKRYSQDGSAQQGGDLDWLSPGQTVPEFEEAMNRLQPGMIEAVPTQFGWHLIKVIERRTADVSAQQQRQQARIAIGTAKSDEQYQDWLRQLRDHAFVEYHLEKNK